jgi:hypothetical protein
VFITMALFMAVWGLKSQPFSITATATAWEENPMLQQLLTGDYTLELDDYVVDKHTQRGRSQGKSRDVFVHEGAVVTNRAPAFEDPWFLLLEDIYINS